MNRYLALATSAVATILFLAGVSIGLALGLSWGEGQHSQVHWLAWGSVVEIIIWVIGLIAPVVILLQQNRAFWPVALVLSFAVAGVSLFRYQSLLWAAADGVGFAMGLLFFQFILGRCTAAALRASERGRGDP